MPVKNKNRQSNSGYEGVITGLNDEEKKVLEDAGIGGGGGKSVPPTLNLIDFENMSVRTTITEEEYNNLKNGLYNQVLFFRSTPDEFQPFMPSKLVGDELFDVNTFVQFDCVVSDETAAINSLSFYGYTFGAKDTNGNYPITITKQFDMSIGGSSGGGSGSSKIWYEISSISNSTITQKQYDEIKSLIDGNNLAGIKVNNEGYFTLYAVIDGNYIFVGYNMSIGLHYAFISSDLSTKESYTRLVKFDERPTSQVIPSFSPIHNAQENLTIGDGLTIENGVIKEDIIEINVSFDLTQEDLRAGAVWKENVGTSVEGNKIWNSINSSTGLPKKAIINISLNVSGVTDLYKILANPYKDDEDWTP